MPLTTLAEIIQAARALSPAERLQLLDAMWDAEHPEAWPVLSPGVPFMPCLIARNPFPMRSLVFTHSKR